MVDEVDKTPPLRSDWNERLAAARIARAKVLAAKAKPSQAKGEAPKTPAQSPPSRGLNDGVMVLLCCTGIGFGLAIGFGTLFGVGQTVAGATAPQSATAKTSAVAELQPAKTEDRFLSGVTEVSSAPLIGPTARAPAAVLPETSSLPVRTPKSMALAQPSKTLEADAGLGLSNLDVRLFVYAPNSIKAAALDQRITGIEATGIDVTQVKRVNLRISQPHIRYYNRQDADAAAALAAELSISARDFVGRHRADTGHIELWLDGRSAQQAPAKVAKVTTRKTVQKQRTGPLRALNRFRKRVVRRLR